MTEEEEEEEEAGEVDLVEGAGAGGAPLEVCGCCTAGYFL